MARESSAAEDSAVTAGEVPPEPAECRRAR